MLERVSEVRSQQQWRRKTLNHRHNIFPSFIFFSTADWKKCSPISKQHDFSDTPHNQCPLTLWVPKEIKSGRNYWSLSPHVMKATLQSTKFLCPSCFKTSCRFCSGYHSVKNLCCWTTDYKTVAQIFNQWMDCSYFSNPVQYFWVRFAIFILGIWPFYDKLHSFGGNLEASLLLLSSFLLHYL